MLEERRVKLFLILSLSFTYIVFWYWSLTQLLPWIHWTIPHWHQTALNQKMFFLIHFLPFITIGVIAKIVSLCYLAASIAKIVAIIKNRKKIAAC